MDGLNNNYKKFISDLLIDWFSRYQDILSDLIVAMGVPEAQRQDLLQSLTFILPVFSLFLFFGLLFLVLKKKDKKAIPSEKVVSPGKREDITTVSDMGAEPLPEAKEVSVVPPAGKAEELPTAPTSIMGRMRAGLAKTQAVFVGRLDDLFRGGRGFDDRLWEELEEILITADVGMKTTLDLREALEKRQREGTLVDAAGLRSALREEIKGRLNLSAGTLDFTVGKPFVLMVIGVNGVGKTTTIGKLAHCLVQQEKKKVILGACDTFRAGSGLNSWPSGRNAQAPISSATAKGRTRRASLLTP